MMFIDALYFRKFSFVETTKLIRTLYIFQLITLLPPKSRLVIAMLVGCNDGLKSIVSHKFKPKPELYRFPWY